MPWAGPDCPPRGSCYPPRMSLDAVVVGSGPNGLAAAIRLAQSGARVRVLERAPSLGGGMRSSASTLPGFVHDVCSAAHPMGILSPFFRTLPLAAHGLRWAQGEYSYAQPLLGEPAVLAERSLEATMEGLGRDGLAYRDLVRPFLDDAHGFLADAMAPLRIPRNPFRLARFGLRAMRSARGLAHGWFRGDRARALFAGCAAHSVLPLEKMPSAAVGVMFALTAHIEDWPVVVGGTEQLTRALRSYFESLGGEVETGVDVRTLADLPEARVALFDTSARALGEIAAGGLPPRYRRKLARFRYGPASYKVDWALDGPIPWRDPRVNRASTVHVGGTFDEVAAAERAPWEGRVAERPFVLMVQQSELDRSRAPAGKHTGYGYIHVPAGFEGDASEAIEAQVERFAPGFRDRILARHVTRPTEFETYNPNYLGGAVTGGVADLMQLFFRPALRLDPYATPNPRLFLCSADTPPGAGVHGMGGAWAARSALRRLPQLRAARF